MVGQLTYNSCINKHRQYETKEIDVSSSVLRLTSLLAILPLPVYSIDTHSTYYIALNYSAPLLLLEFKFGRSTNEIRVGSLHRGAYRPAQTNRIGLILLSSASDLLSAVSYGN